MSKKTVIIGGVAGGATTAARLRRRDETMQIIMFERGDYISYANCGLPYYIGDVISSREALLVQTPEAMRQKYDIDVRTASEVTELMPEQKKVRVRKVKTGEVYEESYDNLVLATGSSPIRPQIPGIGSDKIFTLWSVPDTDAIKGWIQEKSPKRAAVIGGGFIGLEVAENLRQAGVKVTIIEMQQQVMAPLDPEMAALLHENIRMNEAELMLGDGVTSFQDTQDGVKITLTSGAVLETDMVVLSIGVRPNSELAEKAGIKRNKKGGIVVNEYLETSAKDIYAVGDVVETEHFVTKDKTMVPLAGPANRQARILADNLTGGRKKYRGTLGTAAAKVFDLHAASVGVNEKQLKAEGKKKNKDYYTVLINQKSHAAYYPGAVPITLKMIFDRGGKIWGGQIVGQEGVDKRIDTLASVMRLNGTIHDLAELELAYAPPFSSAKDPVNMLGFVAENVLDGMVSFLDPGELDRIMADQKQDYTVLDVTEEMERMVFSIPGSYHIPLGQLRSRLNELNQDRLIIPYCAVGVRSYNAARILMQNGFKKIAVLSGGTSFYKSQQGKTHTQIADFCKEEPELKAAGLSLKEDAETDREVKVLNCCGLQCPGPIMKVNSAVEEMEEAEVLKVSATDMGFASDIEAWCERTGNTFLKKERSGRENIVYLKKGKDRANGVTERQEHAQVQGKTLVVFSGDLDKVLASFIIANGAAAMGRPVTMFFTFWGLNALRKEQVPPVKKSLIEKMFGRMMPKGTKKLKLSKMNMAGMGTAMMKKVMKDKQVESLEDLMKHAMENGVKLVACTMSMDVMGIKKEELIDGVELAGVATYLGDAEQSNVNLFV